MCSVAIKPVCVYLIYSEASLYDRIFRCERLRAPSRIYLRRGTKTDGTNRGEFPVNESLIFILFIHVPIAPRCKIRGRGSDDGNFFHLTQLTHVCWKMMKCLLFGFQAGDFLGDLVMRFREVVQYHKLFL